MKDSMILQRLKYFEERTSVNLNKIDTMNLGNMNLETSLTDPNG